MMMSFCKRSVHSFLGLTTMDTNTTAVTARTSSDNDLKPPCQCGLGIITSSSGDAHRAPNIIESPLLKLVQPQPPAPKKDPGGIGFIDEIGGGVDGFVSCTESLGFESCDERRVDDDNQIEMNAIAGCSSARRTQQWRKVGGRSSTREPYKFPPPLSSLNHNGQPTFFLRPVRKDGRLELTEVRIHRPEILRASRQDGRLRLHLITDNNLEEQESEQEHQDQEEELQKRYRKQEEELQEEEEEEEKEEEQEQEWRFPVSGGDGFRRCHELVVMNHHHRHDHCHPHNHHSSHHHNLHVWSQHCVTTR